MHVYVINCVSRLIKWSLIIWKGHNKLSENGLLSNIWMAVLKQFQTSVESIHKMLSAAYSRKMLCQLVNCVWALQLYHRSIIFNKWIRNRTLRGETVIDEFPSLHIYIYIGRLKMRLDKVYNLSHISTDDTFGTTIWKDSLILARSGQITFK